MSFTFIQPTKHAVVDTEVARFFRRELRCDDVLTFWSVETGQWILAYWLDKDKRLVDEMEDLGPQFEVMSPEFVQMIRGNWHVPDFADFKARLKLQHSAEIRRREDDLLDRQDQWDWLKKKTEDKGAVPMMFH